MLYRGDSAQVLQFHDFRTLEDGQKLEMNKLSQPGSLLQFFLLRGGVGPILSAEEMTFLKSLSHAHARRVPVASQFLLILVDASTMSFFPF